MGLLINVLFPWGLTTSFSVPALVISLAAFLAKATILAVAIGLFESACAKTRFFRLSGLFALALFISVMTLIIEVFG
jgi:formate hydrogenlyase subunit 4